MASFLQVLSMLKEQMSATLSRSDVLRPLVWLIGILTFATAAFLYAKAPDWLLVMMAVSLFLSIGLYVFAYIYCLFIDRDALRSEKYSLNKLAIAHGIYGDSNIGIIEADATRATAKLVPPPTVPVEEGDDG